MSRYASLNAESEEPWEIGDIAALPDPPTVRETGAVAELEGELNELLIADGSVDLMDGSAR